MSEAAWLVGGLAVGGAIIGVVAWRNRQAAKSEGKSVCATVVQPLGRMVGFDVPPQACGVVDKAIAAVGRVVNKWAQYDEDNKRLNGSVALPFAPEIRRASGTNGGVVSQAAEMAAAKGTVLEFDNGCQPFEGAPGWSKCAAGTHDMLAHHGAGVKAPFFANETRANVRRDYMFTGKAGDPFTGIGIAADRRTPDGVFVGGRRSAPCPGKTLETMQRGDIAHDHRTNRPVLWCNSSTGPAGGYRDASGGPSVGTIVTTTGPRTVPTGTVVRDHT